MINFELDKLYSQKMPSNMIPKAAFNEALNKIPMRESTRDTLRVIRDTHDSDWQTWMVEGKKEYTGVWTKRFRKALVMNAGFKEDDDVIAKIGETLNRYTKEGEYHFAISKFMDWRPGDYAERDNTSCWWSSHNNSRLGLKESNKGYSVLLYSSADDFAKNHKKKGIGRCWLWHTDRYSAVFNAYGIALSEIAGAISNHFNVDMLKTELYSQGAYLNKGNRNNDVHDGGDVGLGYILGHDLHELRSPIDLGNFQFKPRCVHCGEKVRCENLNLYREGGRTTDYLCDNCLSTHYDSCRYCSVYIDKEYTTNIFDGDSNSNRKVCPTCMRGRVVSQCEVHGDHLGSSYKVWHTRRAYCQTCFRNGKAEKCGNPNCRHIVEEVKTITLGSTRFALCIPCAKKVRQELA